MGTLQRGQPGKAFGWRWGPSPGIVPSGPGASSPQRHRTLHSGYLPSAVTPAAVLVWPRGCEDCTTQICSFPTPVPDRARSRGDSEPGLGGFRPVGHWGGGEGALTYKGVLLVQSRTPRKGTLAYPYPKVTVTSFLSQCSEGKACGLGCGSGGDPKGPTGQGWHRHVS